MKVKQDVADDPPDYFGSHIIAYFSLKSEEDMYFKDTTKQL